DTVYLASEPLFHVAGLMNLASAVQYGGTNVFTRRVDAEELCRLVATERCTTAYFVDKTIAEIVDVNRDRRYDLSSLRSPRRRRQSRGWHHTNDLGRHEPDGSITWLGSMDRLIKSGSENVYPVEVEACQRRHPAVAECEVVGVPDAEWGETIKAIVVLRPGTRVTCDELVAH